MGSVKLKGKEALVETFSIENRSDVILEDSLVYEIRTFRVVGRKKECSLIDQLMVVKNEKDRSNSLIIEGDAGMVGRFEMTIPIDN